MACTAWVRRRDANIALLAQPLHTDNVFNAFHRLDLLDQGGELSIVGNPDYEISLEYSVMRIDGDIAQHCVGFLGDDRGDVCHDTYVVITDNAQGGWEHLSAFAAPVGTNDAIGVTFADMKGIRAVGLMDLYRSI